MVRRDTPMGARPAGALWRGDGHADNTCKAMGPKYFLPQLRKSEIHSSQSKPSSPSPMRTIAAVACALGMQVKHANPRHVLPDTSDMTVQGQGVYYIDTDHCRSVHDTYRRRKCLAWLG